MVCGLPCARFRWVAVNLWLCSHLFDGLQGLCGCARTLSMGCMCFVAVRTMHGGCSSFLAVFAILSGVADAAWLCSHNPIGLQFSSGCVRTYRMVYSIILAARSSILGCMGFVAVFAGIRWITTLSWLFARFQWVTPFVWLPETQLYYGLHVVCGCSHDSDGLQLLHGCRKRNYIMGCMLFVADTAHFSYGLQNIRGCQEHMVGLHRTYGLFVVVAERLYSSALSGRCP